MKYTKKILSVLLIVCLLLGVMMLPAMAKTPKKTLQFREDGSFKILQFADTQDVAVPREETIRFLAAALDREQPDLVVFTGDNIAFSDGKKNTRAAIEAIIQPVVEREIPFTIVYGNHDEENSNPFKVVSKEKQLKIYQESEFCLAYDAVPKMGGCGTHNLPIYSSTDAEKMAFNLWLIDSNDYDRKNGGYGHVFPDQIAWYEETSKALEKQNGGLVPSLAFQHIIVPEGLDLLLKSPIDFGFAYDLNGNPLLPLINPSKGTGVVLESPCPPTKVNTGEYAAMAKRGDVLGIVVGHDHVNDFIGSVPVEGQARQVDIIQTPSAGFHSYGNHLLRGTRIIELNENDPWNYETHMLRYWQLFGLNFTALADGTTWLAMLEVIAMVAAETGFAVLEQFQNILSSIVVG